VATIVNAAASAGCAVVARGGGLSYTDAYLPVSRAVVMLDMSRMNRVRDVSVDDLHATIEAGCTWADLDAALAPHRVRSLFWGPMSGKRATIGGAMSQGAVTFGSARHGPSGAAALDFEVVLGDGRVVHTSATAGGSDSAFFRHYGPDLTGLFASDCGALGVKTAVTLQLAPRPECGDGMSFAFPEFAAMRRAVSEVARRGLATEIFGIDGALARRAAGNQSREQALQAWLAAGRAQGGLVGAVKQMSRIALSGKRFLEGSPFIGNFLTEATDRDELQLVNRRLREVVGEYGLEIANTIASVTRATPFPDPQLLGPDGMRLLPLHAIVPHSRANALHGDFESWLAPQRGALDRAGIEVYTVFATSGPSAFLYEPVIYWRDSWPALHRNTMPADTLAQWHESAANVEARALVERLRVDIIALMQRHGAAHLQIGRAYPYLEGRDAAFVALLRAIKREADPRGLMNPGVLGL
jgi:D-lactate dehydrogenase (cytochrome)